MNTVTKGRFSRALFALLAVGGLVACGIFIGVISVEGATTLRMIQAVGFGLLGLVMFWGALGS